MLAKISHAYAINVSGPFQAGLPWHDHYDVGHFDVHFQQMANPAHILEIRNDENLILREQKTSALFELYGVNVAIISAGISVVFILLEYGCEMTPAEIVQHLQVMCRKRHEMVIGEVPFSAWLAGCVPGGGAALATDVLQVVTLQNEAATVLYENGSPTALCQSIVSREWASEIRGTAIELPRELNASRELCFAHGRGVIVSAGHQPHVLAGALMVVTDLLFAAAEVRRIRKRLSFEIETLRERITTERNPKAIDEMRRLISEVRQARLTLAMDVIPATSGVDTPDRILDSVRETFACALGIESLVQAAQTQLSTLTEVIETTIAEQDLANSARIESQQRKWQFWISVLSGLVVPFALLLSFFGTGTQGDVHPNTSMWDMNHYWPVWAVTFASFFTVILVSTLRYRRSLGQTLTGMTADLLTNSKMARK